MICCVSTVCIMKDKQNENDITAYTGDSVLLPCSCSPIYTSNVNFTWRKYSKNRTWEVITTNRNRFQLFRSPLDPGNFSLLITDLTEEDDGWYKCEEVNDEFRYHELRVKGRILFISRFLLITKRSCRLQNMQ